jgi:hypothetical protein
MLRLSVGVDPNPSGYAIDALREADLDCRWQNPPTGIELGRAARKSAAQGQFL